ncbi:MAG: SRPBCC family protein [Tenacibaculum sp.]|nr:SRPBCC family protein [Tenacibaculum sp.]
MYIDGYTITVKKSAEELFNFLSSLNNYKALMPENTEKFVATNDSFTFRLKGMPEIKLISKEKTEHSNITLGSASDKFPFTLSTSIKEISNDECKVQFKFDGQFSSMIEMMVKSPLTKFINTLTDNLAKL